MTNKVNAVQELAKDAVSADERGNLVKALSLYKATISLMREVIQENDNKSVRLSISNRIASYQERIAKIEKALRNCVSVERVDEMTIKAQIYEKEGNSTEALKAYIDVATSVRDSIPHIHSNPKIVAGYHTHYDYCVQKIILLARKTNTNTQLPFTSQHATSHVTIDGASDATSDGVRVSEVATKPRSDMEFAPLHDSEKEKEKDLPNGKSHFKAVAEPQSQPAPPADEDEDVANLQLPRSPDGHLALTKDMGAIERLDRYIFQSELDAEAESIAKANKERERERRENEERGRAKASSKTRDITDGDLTEVVYLRRVVAVQEEIEKEQTAEVTRLRSLIATQRNTIHKLAREGTATVTASSTATATATVADVIVPPPAPLSISNDNDQDQEYSIYQSLSLQQHKNENRKKNRKSNTNANANWEWLPKKKNGGKVTRTGRPQTRSMTMTMTIGNKNKNKNKNKFNRVSAPVFGSPAGPSSTSNSPSDSYKSKSGDTHGGKKSIINSSNTSSMSASASASASMPRDRYSISYRPRRSQSPIPNRSYHTNRPYTNPKEWVSTHSQSKSQIPNIFDTEIKTVIQRTAEAAASASAAAATAGNNFMQTLPSSQFVPHVPETSVVNSAMLPGQANSTKERRLRDEQHRWLSSLNADKQGLSPGRIRVCKACTAQATLPAPPKIVPRVKTQGPVRAKSVSPQRQTQTQRKIIQLYVPTATPNGTRAPRVGSLSPERYPSMSANDSPGPSSASTSTIINHQQDQQWHPMSPPRHSENYSPQRRSAHGSYLFSHSHDVRSAVDIGESSKLVEDIESVLRGF